MQETCREEALELLEQLTSFLSIERHIKVLEKRSEMQRAVNIMLDLIKESSEFIQKKTATGLRGFVSM